MENDWVGLIPAAGKGIRLNLPYPKELYPIIKENHYKPVSQFTLENLKNSGIEQIIFVINETKHQLLGYYGDGTRFNCHICYVVQEQRENGSLSTSPGLAHALDSAYYLTRGKNVCFGMADTIMTPSDPFRYVMTRSQSDVILGMFETNHPEKFGMVDMDHQGRVREIIDKPTISELKFMWGLIIWKPVFSEFLHECIKNKFFDFANILNKAIKNGINMQGVVIESGSYSDLGTYDEIAELELSFRAK